LCGPDYGFGGLVQDDKAAIIRDFELGCVVICERVVTICNPYLSEIGNFVKPNTKVPVQCVVGGLTACLEYNKPSAYLPLLETSLSLPTSA